MIPIDPSRRLSLVEIRSVCATIGPARVEPLLDHAGDRLVLGAAPNLPPSYNAAIDGLPIGPNAGAFGTAAYLGRPVYITDTQKDPLWEDFRELAREHGPRACWSTPIIGLDGSLLGTFAIYHRVPKSPTPADSKC